LIFHLLVQVAFFPSFLDVLDTLVPCRVAWAELWRAFQAPDVSASRSPLLFLNMATLCGIFKASPCRPVRFGAFFSPVYHTAECWQILNNNIW